MDMLPMAEITTARKYTKRVSGPLLHDLIDQVVLFCHQRPGRRFLSFTITGTGSDLLGFPHDFTGFLVYTDDEPVADQEEQLALNV